MQLDRDYKQASKEAQVLVRRLAESFVQWLGQRALENATLKRRKASKKGGSLTLKTEDLGGHRGVGGRVVRVTRGFRVITAGMWGSGDSKLFLC
jgi:hypothetical protein